MNKFLEVMVKENNEWRLVDCKPIHVTRVTTPGMLKKYAIQRLVWSDYDTGIYGVWDEDILVTEFKFCRHYS